MKNYKFKKLALSVVFAATTSMVWAQNSNATSALNTVTTEVKKIYTAGANLMLAIGAVVGIVGAIIVFQKWQSGDPQSTRFIAGWIGSTVFLCLAGVILKAMFGV